MYLFSVAFSVNFMSQFADYVFKFAEDLFETSWGVADEDLSDKLLLEMDTEVA